MRPQIYTNFNISVKVTNFKAKQEVNNLLTKVNDLYIVYPLQESHILISYTQRESQLLIENKSKRSIKNSDTQLTKFYIYAVSELFKEALFANKLHTFGVYPQSYLQLASLGFTQFFQNWYSFFSTLHHSAIWQGPLNKLGISYTIRDRLLYSALLLSLSKSTTYSNVSPEYSRLLTRFFYSAKQSRSVGTKNVGARHSVLFSTSQNLQLNTRGTIFPSALTSQKGLFSIRRKTLVANTPFTGIASRYNSRISQMTLKVKSSALQKKGLSSESKSLAFVQNAYSLKPYSTNRTSKQPSYYGLPYLKKLITLLTGNRFSIYALNARSISRFAFDTELYERYAPRIDSSTVEDSLLSSGKKKSFRFLRSLERERVSRFRYVAVYIQDLIRISFFSIYLKKSGFLSSFLAFSLSKLPRNRKETQFLRFLRKLVKVFASQRKEIYGLRIRFQGRVNRWRRTKHIIGEKGSIPFQAYDTRIDYGIAQAITRKGALGIRL